MYYTVQTNSSSRSESGSQKLPVILIRIRIRQNKIGSIRTYTVYWLPVTVPCAVCTVLQIPPPHPHPLTQIINNQQAEPHSFSYCSTVRGRCIQLETIGSLGGGGWEVVGYGCEKIVYKKFIVFKLKY